MKKQPKPKNSKHPDVVDLVIKELNQRKKAGIKTYGKPLRAFNNRSALEDLLAELLDACCYLTQMMYELEYKKKSKKK